MDRLLKFAEQNPTLILGVLGALGAYYYMNKASNSLGGIINQVKTSDLVTGLSHPLDAINALFTPPTFAGGATLTSNYQNYINLNGGTDAYLAAHKNGTFKGAPYNSSTAYPKTAQATSRNPLDIFKW